MPTHRPREFMGQPHIVLINKGKEVGVLGKKRCVGVLPIHAVDQVHKVLCRALLRARHHPNRLGHAFGKGRHALERVVLRSVVAHGERPSAMGLLGQRIELLSNEGAALASGHQEVNHTRGLRPITCKREVAPLRVGGLNAFLKGRHGWIQSSQARFKDTSPISRPACSTTNSPSVVCS